MRLTYIILSCCLLAFTGCNNAGNGNHNGTADSTKAQSKAALKPVQSKLNDEGTRTLMAVMTRYYALKNAFVATKAPVVDSAVLQLVIVADSMQTFLQKDSTNFTALKPYMDTIIAQSKMITTIKDANCEKQRLAFGTLSSAIYGLLKNAEIKNAGIYHQYCPMAFNEKGAFWLSDESEIKNPYFGKKMLECGEVTDSL
ncbi:MAG: DUF3347 domain-containing protein [Chitinophagales bacterium]